MKSWLKRLFARPETPALSEAEAAEVALRVFPKCC